MTLSVELHKKIVDFLISLPNTKDSNGRKALIQGAVLDAQLQSQISFSEPPLQFFQSLIPLLVEYGQLEDGRNTLEAVLEAAKDYIGPDRRACCDQLIDQLRSAKDQGKDDSIYAHGEEKENFDLSAKTYDHFTGRHDELERVMTALQKTEQQRIIALYGLGGIGKTALAREAADLSLQQECFQRVVWVSARTERFAGTGIQRLPVSDLTFESVLNEIARQCHISNLNRQSILETQKHIKGVLAAYPILLVLDNLETVQDYETLVHDVSNLLRGQSKILITSRHKITRIDVYAIELKGLDADEGIVFLQKESEHRGVTTVTEEPHATLLDIYTVTGGAPLAMKLVVGQLSRQPLEVVLHYLKAASFDGQDYEFYRFVYKHSWDMLSLEPKQTLVSMSVFDPETGGSVDMVRQVSKIEEAAFFQAMDVLINMSLVDFVGPLRRRRYVLNQLTHNFILSDIVKKWG